MSTERKVTQEDLTKVCNCNLRAKKTLVFLNIHLLNHIVLYTIINVIPHLIIL